jgi:hypothetical protein
LFKPLAFLQALATLVVVSSNNQPTTKMTITYETADTWSSKKTTVGAPIWQRDPGAAFSRYQTKTGVTLQALYWQPRNRRLIAETYSVWDDGKGRCKGTLFHEIALEEIPDFARVHHTLEDALVSLGFLPQILND